MGPTHSAEATKPFTSQRYHVTLRYPASWPAPTDGANPPYFFGVSAAGGSVPRDICDPQAHHVLRPFGSQPSVADLQVDRHPACLILPSSDQPAEERGLAQLVVTSPSPVTIGTQSYDLLVVYARADHIRDIAATITFVPA